MKILVAILLIGAGVWLFHTGWIQRDSLKGRTQRVLAGVASHLEGSRQFPEHTWFMLGGGAMAALGAGLLVLGKRN